MQVSSRAPPPRSWRVRLELIRTLRWDLPEARCLTLPVAVKRKRFLVPLWVFILFIGFTVIVCLKTSAILLYISSQNDQFRIEDSTGNHTALKGLFLQFEPDFKSKKRFLRPQPFRIQVQVLARPNLRSCNAHRASAFLWAKYETLL